jgi:hypothetical protein
LEQSDAAARRNRCESPSLRFRRAVSFLGEENAMDHIPVYERILLDVLEDYRSYFANSRSPCRYVLIHDPIQHQFMVVNYGWDERKFEHMTLFHFEIHDRKIWMHRNMTNCNPIEDLLDAGIPKSDIVLGDKSPTERQYTGYALG